MVLVWSVCLLPQNLPLTVHRLYVKTRCHRVLRGVARFLSCGFAENALLKSYGIFAGYHRLPLLPGKLSMDKRDSTGFFSTQKACMDSHTCVDPTR